MPAEHWLAGNRTRDSHTYHCLKLRSIFHVEFATEKTLSGQFAKGNL